MLVLHHRTVRPAEGVSPRLPSAGLCRNPGCTNDAAGTYTVKGLRLTKPLCAPCRDALVAIGMGWELEEDACLHA